MAPNRNSSSILSDVPADNADAMLIGWNVTRGLKPLRTSKRLRSASTSNNAAADDTNGEDSSPLIPRGPGLLRNSKRSKVSALPSDSDYNPLFRPVNTGVYPFELETPQAAGPPGNGHEDSNLTLPTTLALTDNTSNHEPSEIHKEARMTLLELPLDVLCLVADHLDVVARACLKFAHPALGCWAKEDPSNLSACARSRIVSLLLRDDASIPKMLRGVAAKGTNEGHCSEYHGVTPKYCVICRCDGHLSRCPGCRIRTCAREGTYVP